MDKPLGKEYLMYAVKIGDPDYAEQIITTDPTTKDKAKAWAIANGFDRFRETVIDLSVPPDFTKTINRASLDWNLDILNKTATESIYEESKPILFTDAMFNEQAEHIQSSLDVPYAKSNVGSLGGSTIITISFEPKDQWANGIMQNSNYALFMLNEDGRLELFSGGNRAVKFRSRKVKTIDDAISAINNYIVQVKGVL